jgi:hypothetical protein
MRRSARRLAIRTRVEAILAATFGILTLVTALWPTWIESTAGLEPDTGRGSLEWAIVAVFAIAACGAAFRARHDLRIVKTAS